MFARPLRLRTSRDIVATLRRGVRRSSGPVSCTWLSGGSPRVTVITDTKVSKKATERNRIKRRARAILRERGLSNGDLVVRLGNGTPILSYSDLKSHLLRCLSPR